MLKDLDTDYVAYAPVFERKSLHVADHGANAAGRRLRLDAEGYVSLALKGTGQVCVACSNIEDDGSWLEFSGPLGYPTFAQPFVVVRHGIKSPAERPHEARRCHVILSNLATNDAKAAC